MTIGKAGLDLIKSFEGFRSKPYRDSVGVWTIGYGSTHYPDGRPVTKFDRPLTKKEASNLMKFEINHHYARKVDHYVTENTTQNQFDAMVSFAYNLGVGALHKSSLLKYHNAKRVHKAAKEFTKWNHAGGRVLKGLTRRRKAERDLFLA